MRSVFLRCVGGIYVCAFVSFWLQYPGLLGKAGLLPAASSPWRQHSTSLLSLVNTDYFDDTVLGISVLGAMLGSLIVCGRVESIWFVGAFMCYLTLFGIGQTWLSFQWDTFLLETGAAAALAYAPLFSDGEESHPGAWVLRTIMVKFMVMSGVVKVTADCPTWKSLTALEYHFASTCLPTSEAWWMHSLPPGLLRLGVAAMFVSELLVPWLLLAPARTIRKVGVVLLVPLQVAIQLTGNYNWFNIHSCVMLLPAWAPDGIMDAPSGAVAAAILAAIVAWASTLFGGSVSFFSPDFQLHNHITQEWTKELMATACSRGAIAYLYFALAATSTRYVLRAKYKVPAVLKALWCALHLGIVLSPMTQTAHVAPISFLENHLEKFRMSHSYGLFRRMTGVGGATRTNASSWGGLPPSTVAVPAVVIEVSVDGEMWREVKLRYALGDVTKSPRRTAPHQPRLDWQMWFAALGQYHQNPWFLHLCYKILIRERDVLDLLLDEEQQNEPNFVRAWLYHYDFTRIDSPWAANIPNAAVLPSNCSSTLWGHPDCRPYWTRKVVAQYIPAVDRDILRTQVVEQMGWPVEPASSSSSSSSLMPPPSISLARLGFSTNFRSIRTLKQAFSIDGPLLIITCAVFCPLFLLKKTSLRKS